MRRKKNRHPLGAEACSNIHSFIYESQICDSAKVSISVLHANIFYCYAFIKIQRQCSWHCLCYEHRGEEDNR